nr:MAG: RNA-dependent RNA polymerase [XiangYun tombus-noda-like virus 10]
MYLLHTPSLPGLWRPQVHYSCGHNLAEGLRLRTLAARDPYTPGGLEEFKRVFRLVRRVVKGRVATPILPWSWEEVVASYSTARMRVRYEAARCSLVDDGVCVPRDSDVSAFVKAERLPKYKVHKPRVIMARSPRYNLELAAYLKPLEHVVYPALRGFGSRFQTHTRLVGKGLGPIERANLIRRKFEATPDAVAVEVDGVSFESHFSVGVLQAEHDFYKSLVGDSRLSKLLSWQLAFRGRGAGVSYWAEGIRASGDFNTGLGNTLVMVVLMIMTSLRVGGKFDMLADGDNCVLFFSRKYLDAWREQLAVVSATVGFEMRLEKPVYALEEVVFGQSKPLLTSRGLTMVRDPYKVLSHAATSFKHYNDLKGGLRVLKSVAYCEAVLGAGVPVLQSFARFLLGKLRSVTFSKAPLDDYEHQRVMARGVRWEDTHSISIPLSVRQAFAQSWGISVEQQQVWEASFDGELPSEWVPADLEGWRDIRDPDTLPFDECGEVFR